MRPRPALRGQNAAPLYSGEWAAPRGPPGVEYARAGGTMQGFLLRRLVHSVIVILGITAIVFIMVHLSGDPVR